MGVHSIHTASFKRVGYFLMYLILVPQDSVCLYAHNVNVCGSRLENGAFSNKKQSRADPIIYCFVQEIHLFHQMI